MKRQLLEDLFSELLERNIQYLVLRKHEEIPDKITCADDLDVLCRHDQRQELSDIFQKKGYSFYQDSEVDNIYLYSVTPHDHFLDRKNDLHMDVVYSLSYRSPNRGEWVPAHEDLQNDIWENVVCEDVFWKYRPSAMDELIHVLCHCILDKRNITNDYAARIQELYPLVDSSLLEKKLALVFFKFSPKLVEYIAQNDMNNIFQKYISFMEY